MYGGMRKNGDSGSTSGPQSVPIRARPADAGALEPCVTSGSAAFLKATIRCGSAAVGSARSSVQRDLRPADVHAEAAGDGEPAHGPGCGRRRAR